MSEKQHTNSAQTPMITAQERRLAAKAVASNCLLPDPRPHFPNTQTWGEWLQDKLTTSTNELSTEACARRQIYGKIPDISTQEGNQALPSDDPRYKSILADAKQRAAKGAALCQWRDFDDTKDEPYEYSGRIINGQCKIIRARIPHL